LNGRVPSDAVRRNSTVEAALFYSYSSGERWRFRLYVEEYRLAGEGDLAKQAGKRKLYFG